MKTGKEYSIFSYAESIAFVSICMVLSALKQTGKNCLGSKTDFSSLKILTLRVVNLHKILNLSVR